MSKTITLMIQYEIEYKSKSEKEERPQNNKEDEYSVEYFKQVRLKRLSTTIRLINFIPPFNGPISYKPLEIIWRLKKEILERDPNWTLADSIIKSEKDPNWTSADDTTKLERQILIQINNIDHTGSWDSEENKLKYTELFQTITKLRTLHPKWKINLAEITNFQSYKCLSCMEKKRLLGHEELTSEYSTLENKSSEKITTSISKPVLYKNEDTNK
jgi:hypothetical protein